MQPSDDPDSNPSQSIGAIDAVLAEAGWVRGLARRLVRDQNAADDVAQGTLTRAIERVPQVEDGLRPWLARVTHRLARRRIRSDLRRARHESASTATGSSGSLCALGTDELLIRLEVQQRLARAVAALPEPYRGVLLLRFFEGQTATQIARRSGRSAATVRSQIARGLERLRAQLNSAEFDVPGANERSVHSFLMLAVGSELGLMSSLAAGLLTMKISTKVAVLGAAATAGLALLFGSGLLDGRAAPAGPAGGGASETTLVEPRTEGEAEPVAPLAEGAGAGRTSLVGTSEPAPSEAPLLEALPDVSTVLARFVDENGHAIEGVRFASIYSSGKPRGVGNHRLSDADGRIRLELEDGDLRAYKTEIFSMCFSAEAAGRATTFQFSTPIWHGTSDLGDIVLPPGGTLTGMVVDDTGAPVVGAMIVAAVDGTPPDLEAARIAGPKSGVGRPQTQSNAQGRFELAGLAAGGVRLWAHAPDCLWALTDEFEVSAGGTRDVGAITVGLVPPELRIDGVVLDPGGAPVSGMQIRTASNTTGKETVEISGPDGTFVHVPANDKSVEIMAVDPTGRLGMSATQNRRAGERAELRLTNKRTIAIHVEDDDGEPVPDADIMALLTEGPSIFAGGGRPVPGFDWIHTDENGDATMEVPGERFKVSASEHGYAVDRAGPFEHATAPEQLNFVLVREKRIEGRVTFLGEPVEHANVKVGQRIEGFVPRESGFPLRFFTSGAGGVQSDADGRFSLPVEPDWTDVNVVVHRTGLATGEVELTLIPGAGADSVDIQLVRGGSLSGTVTPPPGVDVETLVVAASRGDGRALTARPGKDGVYRMEGMAPGAWRVEGRNRQPTSEISSVANRPEDKEFGWNVEIQNDQESTFDIDMHDLGDVDLQGRILIDGAPASGWSVTVVQATDRVHRTEPPRDETDDRGQFQVTVGAGRVQLMLKGTLPGGLRIKSLREIHVRGPRHDWTEALVTAELNERVDPSYQRLRVMRAGPDTPEYDMTFIEDVVDGHVSVRVPVGRSMLQHPVGETPWGTGWDNVRQVTPAR